MNKLTSFLKSKNGQMFIIAVIIAVALFLFRDKIKQGIKTIKDKIKPLDLDMVLKKGVEGNEVEELQKKLINDNQNLNEYGTDGSFGDETEKALISEKGVTEISLNEYDRKLKVSTKQAPLKANSLSHKQGI